MKKFTFIVTTLALALAAGSASAAGSSAGPSAGNFGLNVNLSANNQATISPTDFLVTGRYFLTKNMAVLAGLGLQSIDTGAATNATYTDLGFMGGFRYYLKTDDVAPFIGGRLQYAKTRNTAAAADATDLAILVEAGAEYYLSQHFSLEGSMALGYASQDNKPLAAGVASQKVSGFGTSNFRLSANFYF